MPVLHNRISNDALKAKMLAESEPRTTISFYKYFHIADPKATRDALYQLFTALNVFGRVYLAHEGINAQISVPASNVETFRAQLYAFDPALEGLRLNIALDDDGKSFWVLRMKVRDRIVADGIDDPHFDASNVGEYLQAAEVNAMLDDPDALFIDMRNHYEYEVGHFENALEIPADMLFIFLIPLRIHQIIVSNLLIQFFGLFRIYLFNEFRGYPSPNASRLNDGIA